MHNIPCGYSVDAGFVFFFVPVFSLLLSCQSPGRSCEACGEPRPVWVQQVVKHSSSDVIPVKCKPARSLPLCGQVHINMAVHMKPSSTVKLFLLDWQVISAVFCPSKYGRSISVKCNIDVPDIWKQFFQRKPTHFVLVPSTRGPTRSPRLEMMFELAGTMHCSTVSLHTSSVTESVQ